MLSTLKEEQQQRYYTQKFHRVVSPLQQALQVLLQHIGSYATEADFVAHIYNTKTVEIFMTDTVKWITALVGAIQVVNDIGCPAEVGLLSRQEKALVTVCEGVEVMGQILKANTLLYGLCNYTENYQIYQKLQQYFTTVEQACSNICGVANTVQLDTLMQTEVLHSITALNEQLVQILVALGSKYQPKPVAIGSVKSTVDDKQSNTLLELPITSNSLIDTTTFPYWNNETGCNFFATLPPELLQVIAEYLDPASLFALAIVNKQTARQLLTILQQQILPVSIISKCSHAFLCTPNAVYGCGLNDGYKLGLGHKEKQERFTRLPGIEGKILQVAAGACHTLVLTTIGLYGCGSNYSGQLGLGHKEQQERFTQLGGIEGKILQLVAGRGHTLVLTTIGLYGCGLNYSGQLGLGHRDDQLQFMRLPGIEGKVLQLAVGGYYTLVLTTTGLYGCGSNEYGQLGLGHRDDQLQFTRLSGIKGKVLQLAAGLNHTLVLTTVGLYGCGYNDSGQLGLGLGHRDYQLQFTRLTGIEGKVLQLAAGLNHTLVLTTVGLYGCGSNYSGQLGLGWLGYGDYQLEFTCLTGIEGKVLQLVADYNHTLVLTTTGFYGCGKDITSELYASLRNHHIFQKLTIPFLDQAIAFFYQRPKLQAILNKQLEEAQASINEIQVNNKPKAYGDPVNPNEEAQPPINEIQINNKPKAYVCPIKPGIDCEQQKRQALEQWQADIDNAASLQALFDLFVSLKQAETGILRLHRKNLLFAFGDTDSYKQAIAYMVDKAMRFLASELTLNSCNQLHLIVFEAKRCQIFGQNWKQVLLDIKTYATGIFYAELGKQTDLSGILALFDCINVQKPLGQTHVLRLESKNIFHAYGHTDTYKKALLTLAQQAAGAAFPVSQDAETRKLQRQALQQLKENLQAVKPYFDTEWQTVLKELEQKMQQASAIVTSTPGYLSLPTPIL